MTILKDYKSTVPFVKEILPSFFQEQDSKLIEFMEVYYEWLETSGNVQDIIYKLDNSNYDEQVVDFYEQFRREILPLLPSGDDAISADKSSLLRLAREFYNTKGTPDGIRILFRILFDEEVELDFPSELVFKPSNGEWNQRSILQIREENLTPSRERELFNLAGRALFTVSEFFRINLTNNSIFIPGEPLQVTDENGNIVFGAEVVFFDSLQLILGFVNSQGSFDTGLNVTGLTSGATGQILPFAETDTPLVKTGGFLIVETVTKVDTDLFSVVFSGESGNISRPDIAFSTFDSSVNTTFFAEPVASNVFVVKEGSGFTNESTFQVSRSDIVQGAPSGGTPAVIDIEDVSIGKTVKVFTEKNIESISSFSNLVAYRSNLKDPSGVPLRSVKGADGNITQNAIGSITVARVIDGEDDDIHYLEIISEDYDAHYLTVSSIAGQFEFGQEVQTSSGTATVIDISGNIIVVNKLSENFLSSSDLTSNTASATIDSVVQPDTVNYSLESTKQFKLFNTDDFTLDVRLGKSGSAFVTNFSEIAGQIQALKINKPGSGFLTTDGVPVGVIEQDDGSNIYLNQQQLQALPLEVLAITRIINAVPFGVKQNANGSVQVLEQSAVEALSENDRKLVSELFLDIGTSFLQEGFYSDLKGQPSGNNVIRDGLRFQDFSYTVKSGIPIDQWREIVKTTAHLAGNFLSGEIRATSVIEENANTASLKLFSQSRPQGVNKLNADGSSEFRRLTIQLKSVNDKFNLSVPETFKTVFIDELQDFFATRQRHNERQSNRRDILIIKPVESLRHSLTQNTATIDLVSTKLFEFLVPIADSAISELQDNSIDFFNNGDYDFSAQFVKGSASVAKQSRITKRLEIVPNAGFATSRRFETYPRIDSFNSLPMNQMINSDGNIYSIDGSENQDGFFVNGLREDYGRSRSTVQTI